MTYEVAFAPSSRRAFRRIGKAHQARLADRIRALAEDAYPPGVVTMDNDLKMYRLRVGGIRIIYQVREEERLVLILKVATRADAYRQLEQIRRLARRR